MIYNLLVIQAFFLCFAHVAFSAPLSNQFSLSTIIDTFVIFPKTRWLRKAHSTDFTIESVTDYGILNFANDTETKSTVYAPITYCPFGKRALWFTGDVILSNNHTVLLGIPINSMDVIRNYFSPAQSGSDDVNTLHDEPMIVDSFYGLQYEEGDTTDWRMVPQDYETSHETAVARSQCATFSDTKAVQFYESLSTDGSSESFMVEYEVSVDESGATTLNVTRSREVVSKPEDNQLYWGVFATMRINHVVYMYALDTNNYQDVYLASVPAQQVDDKSAWQYWLQSSKSWTTTEPTTADDISADAVFSLTGSDRFAMANDDITQTLAYHTGASIFYSQYHWSYLFVYVSADDPSTLIIEYGPTPAGPFTSDKKVLYSSADYDMSYASVSPFMFSTSETEGKTGKELLLTAPAAGNTTDAHAIKLTLE
ncbi:hypothetical protein BZA70DRAFT_288132 [Myxozyma melibiosi]|uniref:DUF4185 domain-containing protein n=1 Tax=Myxozyma melibiosi TaxID=54550 RepID=A0ABR1F9Y6_9ASCO